MSRIGVFICHCGANIAGAVDIEALVKKVSALPEVVFATDYNFLCSAPGQDIIAEKIKELNLDAIVTAHCSPTLHEKTFRRVATNVGLNQYRVEVANIREQVSWPHWGDKETASRKAFAIIRQTIEKVKRNISLQDIKVPITRKAMVIGGGIAGIQSALDIADAGYQVYLVEKTPSIGGKMLQLSETFPTLDCPQCIATPKMSDVLNHPNIKLLSYSEIEEVSGFIGNFKVKVKRKPRYIDEVKCTSCKECIINCPVHNEPTILKPPKYSEQIFPDRKEQLEHIIAPYANDSSSLVQVLLDINAVFNYLPKDAIKLVSERLNVPLSKAYQVATFYTAFSLNERGKHIIKVCMGTACHAKNAPKVLDEVKRRLGIEKGQTTSDKRYSLETVNCLGCCALGPVVTIDEKYFHAEAAGVKSLFDKFEKEEMKNDSES